MAAQTSVTHTEVDAAETGYSQPDSQITIRPTRVEKLVDTGSWAQVTVYLKGDLLYEVKHQPARDAILVSLSRCVPVAGQGETRVINIQPKSSHRELGSPEAVTLRFHDAHLANAFLKKLKAEQEQLDERQRWEAKVAEGTSRAMSSGDVALARYAQQLGLGSDGSDEAAAVRAEVAAVGAEVAAVGAAAAAVGAAVAAMVVVVAATTARRRRKRPRVQKRRATMILRPPLRPWPGTHACTQVRSQAQAQACTQASLQVCTLACRPTLTARPRPRHCPQPASCRRSSRR